MAAVLDSDSPGSDDTVNVREVTLELDCVKVTLEVTVELDCARAGLEVTLELDCAKARLAIQARKR